MLRSEHFVNRSSNALAPSITNKRFALGSTPSATNCSSKSSTAAAFSVALCLGSPLCRRLFPAVAASSLPVCVLSNTLAPPLTQRRVVTRLQSRLALQYRSAIDSQPPDCPIRSDHGQQSLPVAAKHPPISCCWFVLGWYYLQCSLLISMEARSASSIFVGIRVAISARSNPGVANGLLPIQAGAPTLLQD